MEHGNLYLNREFCAGDMMRLQGHSDMGGIDAVFDQFVMGKRVTRDAPSWQTPKLASSISTSSASRTTWRWWRSSARAARTSPIRR